MERSEEEIISRCAQGDRQAFNELVARYSGRLYAFVRAILNNHDAADDVTQETFVRAFLNIDKYSPYAGFAQWLFKIAYRLCMNHFKSESRRKEREIRYETDLFKAAEERDGVEKCVMKKESFLEIMQAVQTLSPKQKIALCLFAFEDCSIKDIADVMECSQGTVMSHLHRARQSLQEKLSEHSV